MEESTGSHVFKKPNPQVETHPLKSKTDNVFQDHNPKEAVSNPEPMEVEFFKKPTIQFEKPDQKLKLDDATEETRMPEETSSDEENKSPLIEPGKKQEVLDSSNASKLKVPTQPLFYEEPSWGGLPDVKYSLEEIKNGATVTTIPLDKRSFFSFGRLDNCHVVMAHPTVSRYHAILQFRSTFSNTDEKRGFYLYDLGSTHGTFVNRYRVIPKTYVKVQVGHVIKFGSSTRFFLLHGPEEDQEEESKYSYTEMKEMRKQELERREQEYEKQKASEEEEESRGIDWGMGDDADEETDIRENPFALTTNEDMYRDDPKKVLRCWFEREGQDLKYRIDEKGFGQFRCTIELPIENAGGGSMLAEAVVSGRKKEAAFQCALEACRILDRANLLRQNNQEARKRKLKNWEEDDYYDSDEDNFFDRTGDLENKRKQRMKQVKKTLPTTETYETLINKHTNLMKEIDDIERKLNTMLNDVNCSRENDDNWDSFTSQKQSGQTVDKLELRKLKTTLSTLRTDEEKLRKLINFIKPFELPEIKPHPVIKIKPVEDLPVPKLFSEENPSMPVVSEEKPVVKTTNKSEAVNRDKKNASNAKNETNEPSVPSPVSVPKRPPRQRGDRAKKIAESFSNRYEEDFNNIVWTPPTGQTGDGRTSLNDKLGY